jgi:glycosyltransferase involved in cell wall biosynthesis
MRQRLGVAEGAIDVIPNGIPARPGDREATRRKLGVDGDEVLLLAVGNLSTRKGHALLLSALAELPRQLPETAWRCVIAGRGEERERLERQLMALGLGERVTLLGHRDDIPDLQAAADVYVMPSYWEGMPLAILEAMSAGHAVVASAVGGIPEVIRDGETGVLVPPGSPLALAQALRRVIAEGDTRDRLGAAARQRFDAEYRIEVMADRYERLYFGSGADASRAG